MRRGRVVLGRGVRAAIAALACCALANCASSPSKFMSKFDPRLGVSSSPRVVGPGEPVPKGGGRYTVGSPYSVGGRTYVPQENPTYRAEGLASWYGSDFHGRLTANGEVYDMHGISAAHPTLPLPSYVRVTNLGNGRSVIVRVNDRGPYHSDRLIDLSSKAARLLDFHGDGLARVRVEYVSPAPLEGSDDSVLLATLRENGPAPAPSPVLLASSKPFLPSFFGGSRVAARGPVPTPPDRPYDLGGGQGATEPRPATEVSGSARMRNTQTAFNTRVSADRMPPTISDVPRYPPPPVEAFAPPRADAAPSIMTGRGLY